MASAEGRKLREQLAVMTADLSRDRQEELPLSNRESRVPSFCPTRKNGTDHIAATEKENIKTMWTVKFDDEDARACDGLAVDDARFYAKSAAPAVASMVSGDLPSVQQRAPVSFAIPTIGPRRKRPKKPVTAPSSAASEHSSTTSHRDSWAARRQRAALEQGHPAQFLITPPTSKKTKSTVASAFEFLGVVPAAIAPAPSPDPVAPPITRPVIAPITASDPVSDSAQSAAAAPGPHTAFVPAPFTNPVTVPIENLIDLGDDLTSGMTMGRTLLLLRADAVAKQLLRLAKMIDVEDLIAWLGRESEIPGLRDVMKGLLALRRIVDKEFKQAAAREVLSASMVELMELVSVPPAKIRYTEKELLELRKPRAQPRGTGSIDEVLDALAEFELEEGELVEKVPDVTLVSEHETKHAISSATPKKPVVKRGLAASMWA